MTCTVFVENVMLLLVRQVRGSGSTVTALDVVVLGLSRERQWWYSDGVVVWY